MVKAGRPCVVTQELCCDRVARRVHTSARDKLATGARQTSYNFLSRQRFFFRDRLLKALCRDRELFVATGIVDLVSRHSFYVTIGLGQGRLRRVTEHATPRTTRSCARDRTATVHCVVHRLGHCS